MYLTYNQIIRNKSKMVTRSKLHPGTWGQKGLDLLTCEAPAVTWVGVVQETKGHFPGLITPASSRTMAFKCQEIVPSGERLDLMVIMDLSPKSQLLKQRVVEIRFLHVSTLAKNKLRSSGNTS